MKTYRKRITRLQFAITAIFLSFIFGILLLLYLFIREFEFKPEPELKQESNYNIAKCWEDFSNNIVGEWIYYGELDEVMNLPPLIIFEDDQFITNAWGSNIKIRGGYWSFDAPILTLDFEDSNEYWNDKSASDLNSNYGGKIEFNDDGNIFKTRVEYIKRVEDFTVECKLDHFGINMMNYYLYKKSI